ncbi:MAG TPA: dienelactone hydrolase family protein [Polyangiaceae bacterium]|nr:dienelactone hydrolase family protein [Polyangiaceae bacterium]
MTRSSLFNPAVLALMVAVALPIACGDSEEDDDGGGRGGRAGSAGQAGAGGLAGSAGAGGSGGTGGSAAGSGGTGGGTAGTAGTGGSGGSTPLCEPNTSGTGTLEERASRCGPHAVQIYENGLADPAAYAGATVYYPAATATAPYPIAAFAPGWREVRDPSFVSWGWFLASHGFVVLTFDTNSLNDVPSLRATALTAAIDTLKAEHTRAGSPLQGKVDGTKVVLIGHSMGAGGALIAGKGNTSLKAIVALNPFATEGHTFEDITAPTLILAGEKDDLLAPPATHARKFYNGMAASTKKAYVEFDEMGHSFANDLFTTISIERVIPVARASARYSLAWLKVYVVGDESYKPLIKNDPLLSVFLNTP